MKRTSPVSKLVSKISAIFGTGFQPLWVSKDCAERGCACYDDRVDDKPVMCVPQPEPIRSVVSESGRVYMTLRLKEDMVAMRFTRPGVNNFDILFDRKAMPQMIEIFKEFLEIEAVNQNEP